MKLTRVERLILSNQYRILEKLYPEEARYFEYAQESVNHGYELDYGELFASVYPDEDCLSAEGCREVIDILSMFDALGRSVAHYDLSIDPYRVEFRGFDGNNETTQLNYARHFCERPDGGRFESLAKPSGFNSHAPVLHRYRRMLREWESLGSRYDLSAEEIEQIAGA